MIISNWLRLQDIKDFAERLKAKATVETYTDVEPEGTFTHTYRTVDVEDIDELVKEIERELQ